MNSQMVPKEMVKKGVIDDSHLFLDFNGKKGGAMGVLVEA